MKYNFDELVSRVGTHSTKWESGGHGEVAFGKFSMPFSIADMEFPAPQPIIDAMTSRIEKRIFGYTAAQTKEYFGAVTGWYKRRFDWDINGSQIHVVHGVMQGVRECIRKFSEMGDGVIIQTPVYSPFMFVLRADRRKMVVNQLINDGHGNYSVNWEEFEALCKEESNKVFLFCSPHNPVGHVWSEDELTRMADICSANNVAIISDEIHGDLTRPGVKHIPIAKLRPNNDIVTCVSASKSFNLAGLELANVIFTTPELKKRVAPGHSQEIANPISLVAVAAAYDSCEDWLDEAKEYIDENFKTLKQWLDTNLPKCEYSIPKGTYLAWVNVSPYFSSEAFARECGTDAYIIIEQGDVFGEGGKGFIRINLACQRSMLLEGLSRMKRIISRVNVGDKVSDIVVNTLAEENVNVMEKSKGKKKALVFLRYLGCSTCQYDLDDYNKNIKLFNDTNTDVYCILQSEKATFAEEKISADKYAFNVVLDAEMKLYKQFAVLPAIDKEMLVGAFDLVKIRETAKLGYKHGKYEGEEYQLPAVIVLNEDNTVAYRHYAKSLADAPSATEVAEGKLPAHILANAKPASGGHPGSVPTGGGHPGATGGHPGATGGHPGSIPTTGGHPGKKPN